MFTEYHSINQRGSSTESFFMLSLECRDRNTGEWKMCYNVVLSRLNETDLIKPNLTSPNMQKYNNNN